MKLFVGETQLCYEVREWNLKEYGYIDHIMIIYNEKDDDGKYIDEIIKGPFIVHHGNMIEGSVTFARVNPDNEYVPDGFAVTITKNILSKVMNVFIAIDNTNIHLFPHTKTINPEILKMWENRNDSEMYIKYHDPVDNKNRIAHVENMFLRHMIINYHTNDCESHRTGICPNDDYKDLDVEVIVW